MDIHEIVKKLIGEIEPVGESNEDDRRYENLKALVMLTDKLMADIDDVATYNRSRIEFSMKRAGNYAKAFYDQLGIPE